MLFIVHSILRQQMHVKTTKTFFQEKKTKKECILMHFLGGKTRAGRFSLGFTFWNNDGWLHDI